MWHDDKEMVRTADPTKLNLGGEDGAKFVLPIAAVMLGLVEDLEPKNVVFELGTELLP